jgi:hypothetical protein
MAGVSREMPLRRIIDQLIQRPLNRLIKGNQIAYFRRRGLSQTGAAFNLYTMPFTVYKQVSSGIMKKKLVNIRLNDKCQKI